MDSTNADALYVRGLCLYYEDCIDKAVQFFVQALRMAPDHDKARLACRVSNSVANSCTALNLARGKKISFTSLLEVSVSSEELLKLLYEFSTQNAKALKAKKEEGNKAFKEGNYEAACELYSEALTIDPNNIKTNAKLYCNRATVGSKVRPKISFIKICQL